MINRSLFCVVIICSYFGGTYVLLVGGQALGFCRDGSDWKVELNGKVKEEVLLSGSMTWCGDVLFGTIKHLLSE